MVRKAVVMAGGLATRLRPLTQSTNKHMLALYDRPMIQHVIETVVASGITDIVVHLTNSFAQPVMQLLEDGSRFGCAIYYSYQPMGDSVAKQLSSVRRFMGNEPFLLMLGDSWFRSPLIVTDLTIPHMWVMPLEGFDDFRKYAEVTIGKDRHVVDIQEKPVRPITSIVQTGAWVFSSDVFDRALRLIRTNKEEVRVRTLVREYVQEGRMHATILPPRSFLDCGTFEALFQAGALVREERLRAEQAAE